MHIQLIIYHNYPRFVCIEVLQDTKHNLIKTLLLLRCFFFTILRSFVSNGKHYCFCFVVSSIIFFSPSFFFKNVSADLHVTFRTYL